MELTKTEIVAIGVIIIMFVLLLVRENRTENVCCMGGCERQCSSSIEIPKLPDYSSKVLPYNRQPSDTSEIYYPIPESSSLYLFGLGGGLMLFSKANRRNG